VNPRKHNCARTIGRMTFDLPPDRISLTVLANGTDLDTGLEKDAGADAVVLAKVYAISCHESIGIVWAA
jgi:hypothetical protein